jgi:segregation and condensation protein A
MQKTSTIYHVHTETFEGPIELLLRLIEQRKLPVSEVSLAEVTDDYLSQIKTTEHMPYGEVTQFILVASTLVLIKSRALLPLLQLTEEEEQDIHDLERRLKMYKVFQDLSVHMEDRYGKQPSFARPYRHRDPVFSPDKKMTPQNFREALHTVLATVPQPEKLKEAAVATVVRIEDMMDQLTARIEQGMHMSFNQFVRRDRSPKTKAEAQEIKVEVVVGFLAMLEMVRNGIITVIQSDRFQDMTIEKRKED